MEIAKKMAAIAYQALDDKKGEDIRIIDIQSVSVVADYFLIAHGANTSQVQAMADAVEEALGKEGFVVKQIEGYREAGWILLDYGDVIIHAFSQEERLFYDLERIWRDGNAINIEDLKK